MVFSEVQREQTRQQVLLIEGSNGPSEISTLLMSKGNGPEMGRKYGSTLNGPIGDKSLLTEPSRGKVAGLEINNGPEFMGMSSKGTIIGSGQKQQRGQPWCEHCRKSGHKEDTCWNLHGKPTDWMPRQNTRSRGYQAEAKINPAQNGAFQL